MVKEIIGPFENKKDQEESKYNKKTVCSYISEEFILKDSNYIKIIHLI